MVVDEEEEGGGEVVVVDEDEVDGLVPEDGAVSEGWAVSNGWAVSDDWTVSEGWAVSDDWTVSEDEQEPATRAAAQIISSAAVRWRGVPMFTGRPLLRFGAAPAARFVAPTTGVGEFFVL